MKRNTRQVKVESQDSLKIETEEKSQNLSLDVQRDRKSEDGIKWNLDQNIRFCLFMKFHLDFFHRKKDRLSKRIFKKLSHFLGSRTPRQCRSRYQKMMCRFKYSSKAIQHFQNQIGVEEFARLYEQASVKFSPLKSHPRSAEKKPLPKMIDQEIQVSIEVQEEVVLKNEYLAYPQLQFFPFQNIWNQSYYSHMMYNGGLQYLQNCQRK